MILINKAKNHKQKNLLKKVRTNTNTKINKSILNSKNISFYIQKKFLYLKILAPIRNLRFFLLLLLI